jgi:hypothetical protein
VTAQYWGYTALVIFQTRSAARERCVMPAKQKKRDQIRLKPGFNHVVTCLKVMQYLFIFSSAYSSSSESIRVSSTEVLASDFGSSCRFSGLIDSSTPVAA